MPLCDVDSASNLIFQFQAWILLYPIPNVPRPFANTFRHYLFENRVLSKMDFAYIFQDLSVHSTIGQVLSRSVHGISFVQDGDSNFQTSLTIESPRMTKNQLLKDIHEYTLLARISTCVFICQWWLQWGLPLFQQLFQPC